MAVDCGSQKTEKININIDIGGRGLGAFAINDYNSKCLLTFVQDCRLKLHFCISFHLIGKATSLFYYPFTFHKSGFGILLGT